LRESEARPNRERGALRRLHFVSVSRVVAKNQRERFTFGRVYPKIYSENQNGAKPCALEKVVPKLPEIGEPKFQNVPRLPRTSRPRKWTRSWRFCKRGKFNGRDHGWIRF
jgi:hypothetical protein